MNALFSAMGKNIMDNNISRYQKEAENTINEYLDRFLKYAFDPLKTNYSYKESYEGSIRRWTHIVQKGLAMNAYEVGRGRDAIFKLVELLGNYSIEGDTSCGFYEDGLNAAEEYIKKNKGVLSDCNELINMVEKLPGRRIHEEAVLTYIPLSDNEYKKMPYEEVIRDRHSIRHFSDKDLDLDTVLDGIRNADFTPSACNRKGWTTYVVTDKQKIEEILENQNGNRGFGEEIKVLSLITFDLRFSSLDREVFQAYIDGGLYAMNLMNSLYSKGIATIPLSASLHKKQECAIRKILGLDEAEVFIIFIGMGNYADTSLVTRNSKRNAIKVI